MYDESLRDTTLAFRGSSNQLIIDVNSPYMTYYYKNGSTIIVIPATISARGYRCNTLIIQKEILNTPEYKDKFLAMECLEYGETF